MAAGKSTRKRQLRGKITNRQWDAFSYSTPGNGSGMNQRNAATGNVSDQKRIRECIFDTYRIRRMSMSRINRRSRVRRDRIELRAS